MENKNSRNSRRNFEYEKVSGIKNDKNDSAKIGSSGDSAKIVSDGKYSVICCAGNNSIAKGKIGSWITLAEWNYDEKEKTNIPVCVKTKRIDGEKIKEDTFYMLKKGRFVEV